MFKRLLDHDVHTVSFGAGPGTIVGITGLIGTWEVWQQPFELLSQTHRVITYDHLGAGETRCAPEAITFENQVQLAAAVLETYKVERCTLLGDSLNVAVAIEVAVRYPHLVSELILVCGGPVAEETEEHRRFVKGLRMAFEPTIDAFVRRCLPESDSPAIREWLKDILRRTGGEGCARLLDSFTGVDVRESLARISAPTLIIHGQLDDLGNDVEAAARLMEREIPDSRLVTLDGIGHVPQLSAPELLVQQITDFLAEARAARDRLAVT